METDYTPYEGRRVTGWPDVVMLRGHVVFADGEPVGPGSHRSGLVPSEGIDLW